MVTSPLSLEHCSAVAWRGSGRLESAAAVSPPQSWIEQSTTTRDVQVNSLLIPWHSKSAFHASRQHRNVVRRGVLVSNGVLMGGSGG